MDIRYNIYHTQLIVSVQTFNLLQVVKHDRDDRL